MLLEFRLRKQIGQQKKPSLHHAPRRDLLITQSKTISEFLKNLIPSFGMVDVALTQYLEIYSAIPDIPVHSQWWTCSMLTKKIHWIYQNTCQSKRDFSISNPKLILGVNFGWVCLYHFVGKVNSGCKPNGEFVLAFVSYASISPHSLLVHL